MPQERDVFILQNYSKLTLTKSQSRLECISFAGKIGYLFSQFSLHTNIPLPQCSDALCVLPENPEPENRSNNDTHMKNISQFFNDFIESGNFTII
jgi:hypothetical protein